MQSNYVYAYVCAYVKRLTIKNLYLTKNMIKKLIFSISTLVALCCATVNAATPLPSMDCMSKPSLVYGGSVNLTGGVSQMYKMPIADWAAKDVNVNMTFTGAQLSADLWLDCSKSVKSPLSLTFTKVTDTLRYVFDKEALDTLVAHGADDLYVVFTANGAGKLGVNRYVPVNPDPTIDWESAIQFTWTEENRYAGGNEEQLYRVNLYEVGKDENVYLYMANRTNITTRMRLQVFVKSPQMTKPMSALDDSLTIVANQTRDYTIASAIVHMYDSAIVYFMLSGPQPVVCTAYKLEPEVEDIKCLQDSKDFRWYKTNTLKSGENWFRVNLADGHINYDNYTLQLTVDSVVGGAANVDAAVSFDCPCTGLTEYKFAVQAGETKVKVLNHSMLTMVKRDTLLWVRVNTTRPLRVRVDTVSFERKTLNVDVEDTTHVAEEKWYDISANANKWFVVKKSDFIGERKKPIVTIENKGGSTANIEAKVVFQLTNGEYIHRSLTLSANQIYLKEIESNLVEGYNYECAYILVSSTKDIRFQVRLKSKAEDAQCSKGRVMVWNSDNVQQGGTEVWWKVPLKDAKEENDRNIHIELVNKSGATATVKGDLIFTCPCEEATSKTLKVAGNSTFTKEIGYNLYGTLANDTVFVHVTTDQDVILRAAFVERPTTSEDASCQTADSLITETNIRIAADTATWFYTAVQIFRDKVNENLLPKITVTNLGAATATIEAAYSFDCPVHYAMQSKTITLGAGATFTKTATRDQVMAYDPAQTIYVRIRSTEAVIARVDWVNEDEGNYCSTGRIFNWYGDNIQEGGTDEWWRIPIKELKQNDTCDLKLNIKNLTSQKATLWAGLQFSCNAGVPTSINGSINGGDTQTRIVEYANYKSMSVDTIYVRLMTDQKINITAGLAQRPAVEPDTICLDAQEATVGTNIAVNGNDTLWFKMAMQQFRDSAAVGILPRISITNLGAATANIQGAYTFDCPVTYGLPSKSLSIAAGATFTKTATTDMILAYSDTIQWVYVRVISSENLSVNVAWEYEFDGEDCSTARMFNWFGNNVQEGGTTMWWRIPTKALKDSSNYDLMLYIDNLGTGAANLNGSLAFTCPAEATMDKAMNVAASATWSKKVVYSTYAGVADTVYLQLTTNQKVNMYAKLILRDTAALQDVCAEAAQHEIVPMMTYTQANLHTTWYTVPVQIYRDSLKNHILPRLTIVNCDSTASVQLNAAYSAICSGIILDELQSRTLTLTPGETRVINGTADKINAISYKDSVVYVRLTNNGAPIAFRIDWIFEDEGKNCDHARMFNWYGDNIQEADSSTWWRVQLDVLQDTTNKDVRIFVENLSAAQANVNVRAWLNCNGGNPLEQRNLSIPANGVDSFSANVFQGMVIEAGYLYMTSNQDINIYAKFKKDVVMDSICLTAQEVHYYTYYTQPSVVSRWYSIGTDSIFAKHDSFGLRPRISIINEAATPVTVQGSFTFECPSLPDLDIKTYEIAVGDTLRRVASEEMIANVNRSIVDSLYIRVCASGNIKFYIDWDEQLDPKRDTISGIICQGDSLLFGTRYVYVAGEYQDTLQSALQARDSIVVLYLTVQQPDTMPIEYVTICQGATYNWRGTDYTTDTIVTDTAYYATTDCDSVYYTLNLSVQKPITAPDTTAVICACDTATWSWHDKHYSASGVYKDTARYTTDCDSVYYTLHLTIQTPDTISETATVCEGDAASFMWRGKHFGTTGVYQDTVKAIVTGCDSIYYELNMTVLTSTTAPVDTVYLCAANTATYEWRGKHLTQTGVYRDTSHYMPSNCDSVYYELHLFVQEVTVQETESYTMCASDTADYEWHGMRFHESDLYSYTEKNIHDCDSVVYTINVAINPTKYGPTTNAAICEGDSYTWAQNNQSYNVAGTYYDTVASLVTGCDSILTLTLTVNPMYTVDTMAYVCGVPYTWHRHTFTTVGEYTCKDSMSSVSGCDSIVTLKLTLGQAEEHITTASVCQSQLPYMFEGESYYATIIDTVYKQNIWRCDSLLILNLTVRDTFRTILYDTICPSAVPAVEIINLTSTLTQCDSIIEIHHTMLQAPAVPDINSLQNRPLFVCGKTPQIVEASKELDAIFAQIDDTKYATVVSYQWQQQDPTGQWSELNYHYVLSGGETWTIRLMIKTSCGETLYSNFVTIKVEMPNPDNTKEYDLLPVQSKYDNWMLLLDVAKMEQMGIKPKTNEVEWYRVVDDVDVFGSPDANDQLVGYGYYYSEDKALVGQYYALITKLRATPNECDVYMRSKVLQCNTALTPATLKPGAVKSGERIQIVNINPDAQCTIYVYDAVGRKIYEAQTEGSETYEFNPEGPAGTYLMRIIGEEVRETRLFMIVQ